jgi:metal-responsive CopG/Arc/MetJ family transcriptional regulator
MKNVKADQLRKLLKKKDRMITLRMNPELLRLLDEALEKDREHESRNELIESLILKYLEAKGKI